MSLHAPPRACYAAYFAGNRYNRTHHSKTITREDKAQHGRMAHGRHDAGAAWHTGANKKRGDTPHRPCTIAVQNAGMIVNSESSLGSLHLCSLRGRCLLSEFVVPSPLNINVQGALNSDLEHSPNHRTCLAGRP